MKTATINQFFKGIVTGAILMLTAAVQAGNPELPVNLNSAGDFVILAKSGVSTVPPSNIRGDIGVSPITSTAITGFALIMDSSGEFSTSAQVDGKIYAPDYASPTPVKMTTAISDMETAYTNAAGRTIPDNINLGAVAASDRDIGGLTLNPGLHKWTTGVLVSTNVILDALGDPAAVFIFQIEGDLTVANNQKVLLAGNAQAKNIFWQVAGGSGATIGTTAHFEGILLTANAINVLTGASYNGKLLAQKDVNIQSNTLVDSNLINLYTLTYTAGLGGSILGDSPQFVMEGDNGTQVTAVADLGFAFSRWSDGSLINPRTDLNVMSDITVEAEFLPEYTLTYTAGLGGTVVGDSPQTVMQGEDGTPVTAVPDLGFYFVQWSDGTNFNPRRTDINVMADLTVEAEFAALINPYTLTYTAGPGGSIEGISPQVVNQGANGSPVFPTPDPGFSFVQWSDGNTDNPRSDLNVMADITVEASFVADPVCNILVTQGTLVENDPSGAFAPTGESPTYSVLSSNPAIMIASITPDNRLLTSAVALGDVTITVVATYPTAPAETVDFEISVVGHPTTVSSVFPPHELWNPRFTQEIAVRNDDSCPAIGIRLLFSDLKDGIVVENQTGTAPAPDGRPVIDVAFDFASGQSLDLSVVYLATGASRPDLNPPTIEIQYIMADIPLPADGTGGPNIERIEVMPDDRVFLEFASVPGTTYQIDVMNNFPNGTWVTVALDLLAGSNRTQWIDHGPPATPPLDGVRVYRVHVKTP